MAHDLGSGHQQPHHQNPLDRLVRLLAREEAPGPGLARLGGPGLLDRLLRAALVAALRRGPSSLKEGWGPGRLLEAAVGGAALGAVPVATVARLRGTLERLEAELRQGGFWDSGVPLWWRPLPALSELEEHWQSFEGTAPGEEAAPGDGSGAPSFGVRLPPVEELSAALTSASGPGWQAVPGALAEELVTRLNAELMAAERSGVLELSRGGVGQSDRQSADRTDRVAYLTGFEVELLRAAPVTATFIQWLLCRSMVRLLGETEGELRLHAPGSVMLARYRAPCRGFAPHLDNPGGEADNARALTVVTYLNAPDAPCNGGEIALWNPAGAGGQAADPSRAPFEIREHPEALAATGGTMVAFDARRVVHEVRTLRKGPDRWTAVVWLSDASRHRARGAEPPEPTIGEVLEAVESVPLPAGRVLLRSVSGGQGAEVAGSGGGVQVESVSVPVDVAGSPDGARARVGLVCTTHRVGEGLERWCRYHLGVGASHLLLVIDDTALPNAVARAGEMAAAIDRDRIEIWAPAEAAERRRALAGVQPGFEALARAADGGAATHAVAARQTLNATAALRAARCGDLHGVPLDWLLHLDADELFHLEGRDRGGADLNEHFAAAAAAGHRALRYANHELLLSSGSAGPPRFKLNPRLAAIRLGPVGWRRMVEQLGMEQDGPRPYFRAYWNGKAAVRVAAGRAAAGVHGWSIEGGAGGPGEEPCRVLLGPSILHFHLPTAGAFRDKYLTVAAAEPGGRRPFPPSPLEDRAAGLVRELRAAGVGEKELCRRLDALYREALCMPPEEVELLEEAGLVFEAPAVDRPSPYLQAKTGSS